MIKYELRVEKQQIFGAEKIAIAADANQTVSLRFYFDAHWRIFDAKAAIFRTSENKYYIIEIKGSSATVPWEVLTVDNDFELSVIGYDGSEVLTAGKVDIKVVSSLLPEDCKTFSPSETLFDRIRQQSIAEAFKKYEDELETQKYSYEKKLAEMGDKVNKANENTKSVEEAKNEEIKTIQQKHTEEMNGLKAEITELKATLAETKIKADNWDLVDAAMADKTAGNYAPWMGGTKEFKLPFFNTRSMRILSTGVFSGFLTEIGLDLSSATSLNQMFSGKDSLRRIELRNTDKIESLSSAFSGSTSLREVILGDLTSCTEINNAFLNDTSLEKITIGNIAKTSDYTNTFSGCIALKEICGELDLSGAARVNDMFLNCTRLKEVRFKKGSVSKISSLATCSSLSRESMDSLLEGLKSGLSGTIVLSKYAFENNYPTAEEKTEFISLLAEKGCSLSLR